MTTTRFERRLVAVLTAADPGVALQAAAADRGLPPEVRQAFARAYPDGVRMAALLVARLRFERLLRACPEASAEFDADAEAFAARFRRYHAEVPPTAFFPAAEAALYRTWLSGPHPRKTGRKAVPSPRAR